MRIVNRDFHFTSTRLFLLSVCTYIAHPFFKKLGKNLSEKKCSKLIVVTSGKERRKILGGQWKTFSLIFWFFSIFTFFSLKSAFYSICSHILHVFKCWVASSLCSRGSDVASIMHGKCDYGCNFDSLLEYSETLLSLDKIINPLYKNGYFYPAGSRKEIITAKSIESLYYYLFKKVSRFSFEKK